MNFGLASARRFRFNRRAWILSACLASIVVCNGCGGASTQNGKELSFSRAVEASLDESWESAAEAAFNYIKKSSPDELRYDRALLMLAQAAERLGFSYAASLWYLDIAQARRNIELLDKSIAGLERIIMKGPHDETTLVRGVLATADITDLSADKLAFINYLQGLYNVRDGLDAWADRQFGGIAPARSYSHRAHYIQAVRDLERKQWSQARRRLTRLLKHAKLQEEIRNQAELALARLSMEEARYPQAIKHYKRVKRLAPSHPELLLEMAWAYYYSGAAKRALGLLIALDAPIYMELIAPERFLLEAFCLRQLCQFEPARIAAVRLRERYGEALSDLSSGLSPIESASLRIGARQRGGARRLWLLLERVRVEKASVDGLAIGESLSKELKRVYEVGDQEIQQRLEQALEIESEILADELIAAERGVQLILHELSVGLLRGRSRPPGIESTIEPNRESEESDVSYSFVGEFWTDELDSLVVNIPDRCLK
ncbi:MAG: hypothetical protein JXA30_22915 [Deltaproteobacteria bacterium]|nr:hypothetical protein [Deltaproteobacteria bacterium]